MKRSVMMTAVALVATFNVAAFAQDTASNGSEVGRECASAVQDVHVCVESNVSITPAVADDFDLGSFDLNTFTGDNIVEDTSVPNGDRYRRSLQACVTFNVSSNESFLEFAAAATDLYKADDPNSPFSIPLNTYKGADIIAQGANPLVLGSNLCLPLDNEVEIHSPYGTFPGYETDPVVFQSSDAYFGYVPVTVIVRWCKPDATLPEGDYSGLVRLSAFVGPGEES